MASTVQYYVDRIRVRRHWVFYHVHTYQVRVHYVVHRATKVIAGAAHQSLWDQEGWVLICLVIFGSVSYVARDLAVQYILYWQQHIPIRHQHNNHTMS